MLPGMESPRGKAAYGIAAAALIVFAVSRLACSGRSSAAVQYPVVCKECNFAGEAELPPGGGELPAVCPRCGKRALWLSLTCPVCNKAYACDPKSPPKHCPHCKARLPD